MPAVSVTPVAAGVMVSVSSAKAIATTMASPAGIVTAVWVMGWAAVF